MEAQVHGYCGAFHHGHRFASIIDVLAVLNALRAAFPPKVMHDL